jgi:hypothetical protein
MKSNKIILEIQRFMNLVEEILTMSPKCRASTEAVSCRLYTVDASTESHATLCRTLRKCCGNGKSIYLSTLDLT